VRKHIVAIAAAVCAAGAGCGGDAKQQGGTTLANTSAPADPVPAESTAPTAPVAAGQASASANVTDDEIEDLLRGLVVFIRDISAGALSGKDCTSAGAGVRAALAKHEAFTVRVRAIGEDDALEERVEKLATDRGYEPQLEAEVKGFVDVSQRCAGDPDFAGASEALSKAIGD
jgi:hypothetical protein